MKLVHLTIHFEYAEVIVRLLDRQGLENYACHSMIEGKDREGKHMGSQAHPGNLSVFDVQVPDDRLDELFDALRAFREEKAAHEHLQALVLPIERSL